MATISPATAAAPFGASGDRNSSDPRLGPLGDYGGSTPTHPLLGGPAIDGGTSASAPPSDQRGVNRQDGNLNGAISYDIGAYELEPVDIRLSFLADDSDPVRAGDSQIYRIDVRNGGPAVATGVTLVDTLPAEVSFNNYAETRGGSCVQAGVAVSCSLDGLKPGFVWSIYLYVTVSPTASGTISNSAVAGAAGADTNTANDQASVDTSVTPLPSVHLSAATYNIGEGAGTATIAVQLSAASDRQVSLHYAASNGTAAAPGDYAASAGTLTFEPGQTSKTFSVPISNDALDEPNETILLALSDPNGAVLGTPSGATLTVVDNDAARRRTGACICRWCNARATFQLTELSA